MRTNKIARFIDRDSVIGEGKAELDMTTRFLTVDPMAEKYYLKPAGLFPDPRITRIFTKRVSPIWVKQIRLICAICGQNKKYLRF